MNPLEVSLLQKYETIFVVDSLLKTEEIEAIITKYEKFVSDNGGDINAIEKWGKKRLAYEIKKRQYGYYVLIRFDGPGGMIKQLEREYRLNESILRYMTLLLSKQALKALDKQQSYASAEAETTLPKKTEETAAAVETETPSEPKEEEVKTAEPVAEEPVKDSPVTEETVLEETVPEDSVTENSEETKKE